MARPPDAHLNPRRLQLRPYIMRAAVSTALRWLSLLQLQADSAAAHTPMRKQPITVPLVHRSVPALPSTPAGPSEAPGKMGHRPRAPRPALLAALLAALLCAAPAARALPCQWINVNTGQPAEDWAAPTTVSRRAARHPQLHTGTARHPSKWTARSFSSRTANSCRGTAHIQPEPRRRRPPPPLAADLRTQRLRGRTPRRRPPRRRPR